MEKTENCVGEVEIEQLRIEDGKRLIKFPFLEVPVEVGENFYKTYFEN